MMLKMHHKTTVLVAPSLHNSSCSHIRYNTLSIISHLSPGDIIQAFIVLMLTVGVLLANLLLIVVINSRRYSKYIHSQPRYLLTSLASNDLAMGLLVTPFAIVPSLRRCWPYGELVCQIQALLRGAISQQSAVILICMAMDRYMCMLYPARYHKHSSKKRMLVASLCGTTNAYNSLSGAFSVVLLLVTYAEEHPGCVALISTTWILSVTLFSILVLPRGGYYFNATGMNACEPFYAQASIRILAACGFYFPTTMILMYCYGSAFHVNKLRLRKASSIMGGLGGGLMMGTGGGGGEGGCSTIASPDEAESRGGSGEFPTATIEKIVCQERKLSTSASRTMAAMSLGFIVLVTPWTIQEVVAACTGTRAPLFLDFFATWLALSNSFWNPFLYWLLNGQFRRISREILFSRIFCCKSSSSNKKHEQQQMHLHHDHMNQIHHHHNQPNQQSYQPNHHQPGCCSNSNTHTTGLTCVGTPGSGDSTTLPQHFIHAQGCDFERLSEKYWGEILERTLSSTSLHALQRAYTGMNSGNTGITRYCSNGGLIVAGNPSSQQELRMLDTSVPDL